MNQMGDSELSRLSTEFRIGLNNNLMVFGEHAFRKHVEGQTRRSVINASLWYGSCALVSHGSQRTSSHLETMISEKVYMYSWPNDDFIASITYGTNATRRVNHRFECDQ